MRAPVLHIAPFLWSGAGGVIARLCEAQRREGPVVIVTTGQDGELSDWPSYRRRLRRAGVKHHRLDFFHRESDGFWSSATALAALIRDLEPGVIHAHAGVPSCGAVVARSMIGCRARVIGQMYSWGTNRPAWMDHQDAWGLGQTDRVVCSARAYWDLLVSHGVPTRKLTYLPWGLPLDELPCRAADFAMRGDAGRGQAGSATRSLRSSGPVIGFVGRVEPRKGQLALVDAFARVLDTHPTARLQLVGPVADEAYGARVREAIGRHGLENSVTLTGKIRDVAGRIASWDLFVSLSADEGQGLAVLEAMAIGVPVAARAVAGISDFLVDGRTGFAIDGASSRAGAVLTRLLFEPARMQAVATRARRLVERRYDWRQTVRAFDRLYWD